MPIMVMDGSGNWLYSFEYGASGYLGYNSPSLTSFPTMSATGDFVNEYSPTGGRLLP